MRRMKAMMLNLTRPEHPFSLPFPCFVAVKCEKETLGVWALQWALNTVRPSRISDLSRLSRRVVKERKLRRGGGTQEPVKSSLTSKLNPAHLEVIDTSGGCGASFAIEIVSEQFEGKRLLERHRLVNSSLEEEMKEIHALSKKKALTPEQWKQQQESQVSKPAV